MIDDVTAPASSPTAAADGPVRGQIWARYVLLEELGAGGMGAVWAAYDPELDRQVALKVLHDELLGRASQARLRDEAKAMARIAHPNVVPVFDVGEYAGRTYYTMELVRGRSLKDWLRDARGWREVVGVFVDAARGLAALHAAGLVHRDVKPGNVLLGDDGRARIADLGIAMTALDADLAAPIVATTTIQRAGTPAYMAPEQLRGGTGDAASDQFALGVALWEALHGRPPFDGETIAERLAAIDAPPIAGTQPLPRALDAVARRMLAIDPAARFADVAALARALDRPRRPRLRRWSWAIAGAAVIAIGAGAVVVATTHRADPADACRADAARALVGVWDAPIKQQLAAAFAGLHVGYAAATWTTIARDVDRYAADWQAGAQAACRARIAGEPDATAAHQAACLAERRAGVQALTAPLVAPTPELLDHALALVRTLAPVADCADPGYLAALAASADPDRARIRDELAAARVANASARGDAIAIARHVLDDAHAVGDHQLEAEALLAVGRAQWFGGDLVGAVDTLAAAAAMGDVKVKLEAWARGSSALQGLGRFDEATQLLDLADAALKTSPDPAREAFVVDIRGTLLGREGHYDAARVQFERARDLFASIYGPDSATQVVELHNLATALRKLGRLSDALVATERALEIDRPLGDHPIVADDNRQIAVVLSDLGRFGEARDLLTHAASIVRASPTNRMTLAAIDSDLSVAEWRLFESDAAIAALREAVAIRLAVAPDAEQTLSERATLALMLAKSGDVAGAVIELHAVLAVQTARLGAVHPAIAHLHGQLADALLTGGKLDDALAEFELQRGIYAKLGLQNAEVARALADEAQAERQRNKFAAALAIDDEVAAMRAKVLPPDDPELHFGEIARGTDELQLAHFARAITLAEAALAGLRDSKQPGRLADARWLLANALWEANRDRPRAIELARAALADLAMLEPNAEITAQRAEITAWIAKHAPPHPTETP